MTEAIAGTIRVPDDGKAAGGRLSTSVIPMLPNFRDLGGHRTDDGRRVRRGVVYRSVDLGRLDDAGRVSLADHGIRTVYDLRTIAERDALPDRVPDGAEYVGLDVLADSELAVSAQLMEIFANPASVTDLLGGGRTEQLFERSYRDIVSLPSARDAYRRLFIELAEPDRRPALIHCTAGKDRTGWAAASLLTLLGVPSSAVVDDYLRTNTDLLPALEPVFDQFAAAGGDPALLMPVLGVRIEYLDAAWDEMRSRFGSVDGYFARGLGIDDAAQQALRAVLLESVD